MARVIRCDRCGRIVEELDNSTITIGYGVYTEDICSCCYEDFRHFMNNEDVRRQVSVRKENNND